MRSNEPFKLGKPLDRKEAAERAMQAAVLGDASTLRVLSAIASGVPESDLASTLHISSQQVVTAIEKLNHASIVQNIPDVGWTLSAQAWVRFGRLLTAIPATARSHRELSVTALPEAVTSVARDLAYRFSSTFSPETVSRYVAESYALLGRSARVRTHLATLTARYAAERLDALAKAEGRVLRATPEVLFICVQNAGRSQLAAAYLRYLAGDAVHVRTAGSAPTAEVHPQILEALDEAGIPFADDFPKPLTDEVVQAADYVVTKVCGDTCPVYPGRRYLDWQLDDPLELDREGVSRVRDEVREHVEALMGELGLTA
jgi:protein-tyrosine-phosphatase